MPTEGILVAPGWSCDVLTLDLPPLLPTSSEQPKPIDALFGKARFYLQRHNFSHSLEVMNQAVAGYPRFLPALVEKMKVQLALLDWDQAMETAHR